MKNKILLILLICIFIYLLINIIPIEKFINIYGENMIEFTQLDGTLIKKFKIGSFLSLYDQEVINLFIHNETIRINIPKNYFVKIIYKFKNESKGFGQIIELYNGVYDINKYNNNKIIYQIDILPTNQLNLNNNFTNLTITDNTGEIIYTGPEYIPIDWDIIYENNGYDDYNIYYPSTNTIIPYYYYNFPRYNLYLPSTKILKSKSKYYFNTNNFNHYRNINNNYKKNINPIHKKINPNNHTIKRKLIK